MSSGSRGKRRVGGRPPYPTFLIVWEGAKTEPLLPLQGQAIKHAQKLLASYPSHNPEKDNPSTRVHELVELLRAAQQGSPD